MYKLAGILLGDSKQKRDIIMTSCILRSKQFSSSATSKKYKYIYKRHRRPNIQHTISKKKKKKSSSRHARTVVASSGGRHPSLLAVIRRRRFNHRIVRLAPRPGRHKMDGDPRLYFDDADANVYIILDCVKLLTIRHCQSNAAPSPHL